MNLRKSWIVGLLQRKKFSTLTPRAFLVILRIRVRAAAEAGARRGHFANHNRIRVLLKNTHASRARHKTYGEVYNNAARVAKSASVQELAHLMAHYTDGEWHDAEAIRIHPHSWGIRYVPPPDEQQRDILRQVQRWTTETRAPINEELLDQYLTDVLSDTPVGTTEQTRQYCTLRFEGLDPERVYGKRDKDAHRMWSWTRAGYLAGLLRALEGERGISLAWDLSLEDAFAKKDTCMRKYLPTRFWFSGSLPESALPYFYGLCKLKCWRDGEHICPKVGHQCMRLIGAEVGVPRPLQLGKELTCKLGRAVLWRYRDSLWQVWNMCRLRDVLQTLVTNLTRVPAYLTQCPCGAGKDHAFNFGQLGAAAFFVRAKSSRGVSRFRAWCAQAKHDACHSHATVYYARHPMGFLGGPTNTISLVLLLSLSAPQKSVPARGRRCVGKNWITARRENRWVIYRAQNPGVRDQRRLVHR